LEILEAQIPYGILHLIGTSQVRLICCSEQQVMVPLFQSFVSELLQAMVWWFHTCLGGS
jgi:hypothetical protein